MTDANTDAESGPQRPQDGWRLVSVAGVPVFVTRSWLLASIAITVVFAPAVFRRLPDIGFGAYLVAFVFAVLLGLSVLVHELAHSVVAQAFGMHVRRITLHLLGGVSEITGGAERPGADLVVAAVGPLASLGVAGLSWVLWQAIPGGGVLSLIAWQLTIANLIVGVFNLLPGLPLDGGRILRDVVWGLTRRESLGTVVAGWTGRALAVAIVLATGVPLLAGGSGTFALIWAILVASFIWVEAGRALRSERLRRRLPAITARGLARRAIPVPGDLPVSEALRRLGQEQAGGMVAVDGSDRPVGIANEAAISALPVERRPWVTVASVSRSFRGGVTVPLDAEGQALLQLLDDHPAPEYLVVDADGSIYGVLSHDDVAAALTALDRSGHGNGRRG
ncbi:MAG: site-2 protease family protein [Actinomycetes bacterium]